MSKEVERPGAVEESQSRCLLGLYFSDSIRAQLLAKQAGRKSTWAVGGGRQPPVGRDSVSSKPGKLSPQSRDLTLAEARGMIYSDFDREVVALRSADSNPDVRLARGVLPVRNVQAPRARYCARGQSSAVQVLR